MLGLCLFANNSGDWCKVEPKVHCLRIESASPRTLWLWGKKEKEAVPYWQVRSPDLESPETTCPACCKGTAGVRNEDVPVNRGPLCFFPTWHWRWGLRSSACTFSQTHAQEVKSTVTRSRTFVSSAWFLGFQLHHEPFSLLPRKQVKARTLE